MLQFFPMGIIAHSSQLSGNFMSMLHRSGGNSIALHSGACPCLPNIFTKRCRTALCNKILWKQVQQSFSVGRMPTVSDLIWDFCAFWLDIYVCYDSNHSIKFFNRDGNLRDSNESNIEREHHCRKNQSMLIER